MCFTYWFELSKLCTLNCRQKTAKFSQFVRRVSPFRFMYSLWVYAAGFLLGILPHLLEPFFKGRGAVEETRFKGHLPRQKFSWWEVPLLATRIFRWLHRGLFSVQFQACQPLVIYTDRGARVQSFLLRRNITLILQSLKQALPFAHSIITSLLS